MRTNKLTKKKLPQYTKVGDQVVALLKTDAEKLMAALLWPDTFTSKEFTALVKLLDREIHRY